MNPRHDNDLRSMLKDDYASLADELRGIEEFDAPAAWAQIRQTHRRRTVTQRSVAAAVAAVAIVGGWFTAAEFSEDLTEPIVTPSVSPSATAVPTPSPSPGVEQVQRSQMTDAELLERAANPLTGEVWLDEPVVVERPAWTEGAVPSGGTAIAAWYRIGERGGREIYFALNEVGYGPFYLEANADGSDPACLSWPLPGGVERPYAGCADQVFADYPSIREDADTFYDSLGTPSSVTAPNGISVTPHWSAGPVEVPADAAVVASFGPTDLLSWVDADDASSASARVLAATEGRMTTIAYAVRYPFGATFAAPTSSPLEGSLAFEGDLAGWAQTTKGYKDPSTGLVAFTTLYGTQCTLAPATLGTDEDAQQWQKVGTASGVDLYIPTSNNPLVAAAHQDFEDYQAHYLTWNENTSREKPFLGGLTQEEFRTGPAIIGTPAPDGSGWWIARAEWAIANDGC